MRTFFYFIRGFKIRNLKLALFLWLFNLIISSFFFVTINKFFSLNLKDNFQNIKKIGIFNVLSDSIANSPVGFKLTIFIGFFLIIIYILFGVFFSAGTLGLLISKDKVFAENFFSESIYNFFKILKMFIINIVNWFVTFFIVSILFIILFKTKLIEKNEALFEIILFLIVLISLLIVFISSLIYDFSRIIKLKTNKNMMLSFTESVKLIFNNLTDMSILSLTYFFCLLMIYIIYKIFNPLNNIVDFFIFSFVFYQIFIFLKYYLKTVLFSAEIKYFEAKELEKAVIESKNGIVEQII